VRKSGLSLPQQAFALKSVYAGTVRLRPSGLSWRGQLKPSELSGQYLTEVSLGAGQNPVVNVIEPALRPDERGRLPHIWEDGSLCLNTAGQWSPNMLLVDTVIPWSSEWLFHYEIWKGTGIWFGDGTAEETPEAQSKLLHPLITSEARATTDSE
jgi:hypothetical protein